MKLHKKEVKKETTNTYSHPYMDFMLLLLCIDKYTSLEAIKSTKPLDPQPFSLRIQKILTKSRNITP